MILVGDIGGTKTILALYSIAKGTGVPPVHTSRFKSADYSSLEAIIREFLDKTKIQPVAASFGIAGPVKDRRAEVTNLPWSICADQISNTFNINKVLLLNDLESIAMAVPHLDDSHIQTINKGSFIPRRNMAVIAPGTGLGTASLVWNGRRYQACASEGGHASFSPRNTLEIQLLEYLQKRYSHVSFERVCSGGQLPNLYDFLKSRGDYSEPAWLREKLACAADKTPTIIQTALEKKADICIAALDLFVQTLGTIVGNMALSLLPASGIYLGGGIPPRILARLKEPDFINAFTNKGRFEELCASMPVHVILSKTPGLDGAAWHGIESIK